MHNYLTIRGCATAEIEEKRSRFIASVSFADTEETALRFISCVKKQHTMANHNVYAYVLREGARMRSSDDGEPSKTAGLPVLDAIRHAKIADCVIVVTRYFGGTLLGTGGLVRAYGAAARAGLESADIVTISECVTITAQLDYSLYEQAMRLIAHAGAKAEPPIFEQDVQICFTMLSGEQEPLIAALSELSRGKAQCTCSSSFYTAF